jgi:hypothetical protein
MIPIQDGNESLPHKKNRKTHKKKSIKKCYDNSTWIWAKPIFFKKVIPKHMNVFSLIFVCFKMTKAKFSVKINDQWKFFAWIHPFMCFGGTFNKINDSFPIKIFNF